MIDAHNVMEARPWMAIVNRIWSHCRFDPDTRWCNVHRSYEHQWPGGYRTPRECDVYVWAVSTGREAWLDGWGAAFNSRWMPPHRTG